MKNDILEVLKKHLQMSNYEQREDFVEPTDEIYEKLAEELNSLMEKTEDVE